MARRGVAAAAAVLAALVAASGTRADTRPIIVYRPAGLSHAQKVPLVVVLHGRDGQPRDMEKTTGFDRLADQYGFVVAYLKSAGAGWDSAGWSSTDDLDYIGSEIDQLTASENVDPARIYVAGLSSGAYMAYRVGCELAGKVAAIGEVAGGMATDDLPSCKPSRPVSLISVHGDADTAVPLGGKGKLAPLASTLDRWRTVDGCAASPVSSRAGNVGTQTWDCTGGAAIELVIVQGEPHDWPADFQTTNALWSFFSAHTAPPAAQPALKLTALHRVGRIVTVTVRLATPGSLTASLVGLVTKRVAVSSARTISVRVTAPAAAKPPYRLTLVFTSAAGTRTWLKRTVR